MSYVPHQSSIISTQIFVLNLGSWSGVLPKRFFFWYIFNLIFLGILLPVKSPVASAFCWIVLFEAVLSASVADCLASWRSLGLYLLLKFCYFCSKFHSLLQISNLLVQLNRESLLYFKLYLMTKVLLISSSTSIILEFWSVNHALIYKNSELKVFKNINF